MINTHVSSYSNIYLPCLLNFIATTIKMLESKHMIPNATKPPTTPPTRAAVLHVHELSKGTKDVCACVCELIHNNHNHNEAQLILAI